MVNRKITKEELKEMKKEEVRLVQDDTKYGDKRKVYEIKSDVFYGDVRIVKEEKKTEISGGSFRFDTKEDINKFIQRLQEAAEYFDKGVV